CIIPETLPHVEKVIRSNNAVFDQQPDGVLEELFLTPLKAITTDDIPKRFLFRRAFKKLFGLSSTILERVTHIPRLVVVDGLDECKSPKMQTHIRAAINDLFGHIPLHRINLDEDQDIRKDLDEYYHNCFSAISCNHPSLRGQEANQTWPSQEQIEALIVKSSTQFIFASTVMNYISHHCGNPLTRLDIVLRIKVRPQKDKPFLELNMLYRIILLTVQEDKREVVFLILSFIYLAGKGDYPSLHLRASPKFLEQFLRLDVGDVPQFLDPLVSILSLPEAPSGPITILYASFFDYLCDSSRSEDLAMKFGRAHKIMALEVLEETEKALWQYSEYLLVNTEDDVSTSNCVLLLDSFLLHVSRACMSLDLILALFALEQSIILMILCHFGSSSINESWLADCRSQINTLLVSKLGGRPASHDSLFHDPNASSEHRRYRYQQEMANLIIQFVTDEIDEDTLTSLIHRLQSGLDCNFTEFSISGKLTNETCRPLLKALIQTLLYTGEMLYRKDIVYLLRDPHRIINRYEVPTGNLKYAQKILEFIREFRHQSSSSKIQVADIDPALIIDLEDIWKDFDVSSFGSFKFLRQPSSDINEAEDR
ncbi:hypothetical protein CPB83DRAFT_840946, partial [Crepidotus variabilis]